ncbi:hypothetical protein FGO68_gene958 [Halteria grandinella]|uniref:Uncharacterized protein n=1 Tax=Halteria grandinella TaxID=5974 RepID=A0A8J8NTL1_HALGN|nr:hypothetical protein FGO68_gene958 [Halteria grandinella]
MSVAKQPRNFIGQDSLAKCFNVLKTGQLKDVSHLLLSDDPRKLWLSPQNSSRSQDIPTLILDISDPSFERPEFFRALGLSCWHAYTSNPETIKLSISSDGVNFVHWQNLKVELRAGRQVFKLREKVRGGDLKYLKLEIIKIHGGQQTYINQLFLYEKLEPQKAQNKLELVQNSKYMSSQSYQDQSLTNQSCVQMIYTDQYVRPDSQITIESHMGPADKSTIKSDPFSMQNDSSILLSQQNTEDRIPLMLQELEDLQVESKSQFNLIQKFLSQKTLNEEVQVFLQGLIQGYRAVRAQIDSMEERISNFKHPLPQRNVFEMPRQYSQAVDSAQIVDGTSTFRGIEPDQQSQQSRMQVKEELVSECLEQCKAFIQNEVQKIAQNLSSERHFIGSQHHYQDENRHPQRV